MYLSRDTAPLLAELDKDEIRETEVLDSLDIYFKTIVEKEEQMSLREWNYSWEEAGKPAREWLSQEE